MAYKTKAEKKAFRAGMAYQKKRSKVYKVGYTNGKGGMWDGYFLASSKDDARAKARAHMKKNPKIYANSSIRSVSWLPMDNDIYR